MKGARMKGARMGALTRCAAVAATAALLLAAAGGVAGAAVGDTGHDVSKNQCPGVAPGLPTTGAFGIVNVTYGQPYGVNPCLADETSWMLQMGAAAFYVNTANPGHTSPHWPSRLHLTDPVPCVATTSDTDARCAYDYGWHAARDAFASAKTGVSGQLDPTKVTWWLDVEGSSTPKVPGNSWVGSPTANAADIQGFVDGLRTAGVRSVGIYATALQWADITGNRVTGYRRGTAMATKAAWKIAPVAPIEDLPVWVAGVGTLDDAKAACAAPSFTGGQVLLAQYADDQTGTTYDGDVVCRGADTVRPTVRLTAPAHTTTNKPVAAAAWAAKDTGGAGLASYDVRYRMHKPGRAYGAWVTPASWQRTGVHGVSVLHVTIGSAYCFEVRARDAAGNVSSWTAQRCVKRTS